MAPRPRIIWQDAGEEITVNNLLRLVDDFVTRIYADGGAGLARAEAIGLSAVFISGVRMMPQLAEHLRGRLEANCAAIARATRALNEGRACIVGSLAEHDFAVIEISRPHPGIQEMAFMTANSCASLWAIGDAIGRLVSTMPPPSPAMIELGRLMAQFPLLPPAFIQQLRPTAEIASRLCQAEPLPLGSLRGARPPLAVNSISGPGKALT